MPAEPLSPRGVQIRDPLEEDEQITLLHSFRLLLKGPKTFWVVMLINLLTSFCYFSMSFNLALFLTHEYDFGDKSSGWLYGVWGLCISVWGLFVGMGVDKIGVRRSIILGSISGSGGWFLFFLNPPESNIGIIYVSILFLQPLGLALTMPIVTIATKRSTSDSLYTFAFGFQFGVSNAGALLAGVFTDVIRHVHKSYEFAGTPITPLRIVYLVGSIVFLAVILIAALGLGKVPNEPDEKHSKPITMEMIQRTVKSKTFLRLVTFSTAILFCRMLYRQLDATFPKYLIRTIGPDVDYGTLYAVNPLTILILSTPISYYTRNIHPYKIILIGTTISASSAYWLCITGSYYSAVAFLIVISIGEATYSPRVMEYTMLLCPSGEEGIYSGMASVPMYLAKLAVGGISGALLQDFCQKEAPSGGRRCGFVWLIIGLMTMLSPLCFIFLRNFIQPDPMVGRMRRQSFKMKPMQIKTLEEDGYDEGQKSPNVTTTNKLDAPLLDEAL